MICVNCTLRNESGFATIKTEVIFLKQRDLKKQNERIKSSYDRLNLTFPKGKKEVYREFAKQQGKSLNALINELLEREINNAR